MTDEQLVATNEELVKMARLAQRDDRMSTGALYGDLADHIEALTKERDNYAFKLSDANNTYSEMHVELEALTEQLEAARADAKEAEAYAEELEKELNICRMAQVVMENGIAEAEKERDDYAFKLADANNTYNEMHVALSEANDKLATCEKYRDAYAECDRIGTQAVRELEAKLTTCEEIGRAAEEDASQLREKLRARTAERNHANDVTDAAIEEVNRLKALLAKAVEALERIGKGDYRINNVPDYVKDPQPTAKDIARTTLSALLNDVAEGKAEIEGSDAP
jgi:chromosome segregation ATPase